MLNFRLPLSWLFCVRSLSSFSLLVLKQIKLVHSFQVCLDWGSWLTIWNVFPGTSETIGTLYQSGALWHQSMDQLEQDPFLICRPTTTMCNWNIGWNDGNWYCFFSSHSCMNCGKIVLRKVMHTLNKMFIMHADVFKGWSLSSESWYQHGEPMGPHTMYICFPKCVNTLFLILSPISCKSTFIAPLTRESQYFLLIVGI
jgi:hypothetical protein